tara:strand:+ start:1087 stop:2928 length:1842 start_codon:yes stop_codon:yes gene_type:complete
MASTDTQFFNLKFIPGFHRESTKYAEEGKWFDGNRVRFREGKPENLRGYTKFSTDTISGFARDALTWTDNNTRKYLAYGTNTQLYVVQNENRTDSTPIASTTSVANNFDTSAGTARVKVNLGYTPSHTVSVGDRIEFVSVDNFAGTSVNGTFAITSVSAQDAFFITANQSATSNSTGVGGTNGKINLLIPNELPNDIQGLGYGAGTWNGERAWNSPASSSDIVFQGAQWKLDTYGEDLLALRRKSKIAYLDVSENNYTLARASIVDTAPYANSFIVSPNDGHVVCYGASTTATDTTIVPLRVAWSDQNNFRVWQPTATNTAGSVNLTEGSRIVGAIRSRNTINIWTDKAMYIQEFVGTPFIFRFTQVGSNCGMIGPHAAVDIDGVSYWMGDNNFYMYDGRVNTMPCTIRRHLFDNFNMVQKDKVYAGINSEFKEIIWLYPQDNSLEPNAYVIYNYEEQTWVYGNLFENGITTTFADRGVYDTTILTGRTSATGDMIVWNNEPDDIYTGDGQALSSFIESAEFDLDEGKQLMFADKLIPDYTFSTGEQIKFSIKTRRYPSDDFQEKGPFTINADTQKVNMRARGRQSVVRVSADAAGQWRWGSVRLAMQPDGER